MKKLLKELKDTRKKLYNLLKQQAMGIDYPYIEIDIMYLEIKISDIENEIDYISNKKHKDYYHIKKAF